MMEYVGGGILAALLAVIAYFALFRKKPGIPLMVKLSQNKGYPSMVYDGFLVEVIIRDAMGPFEVFWGDGETDVLGNGVWDHVFRKQGTHNLKIDYGGRIIDIGAVEVLNEEIEVYYPFCVQGIDSFERHEKVSWDVRFRQVGCDASGHPTGYYGMRHPRGYPLTFEWHIQKDAAPLEDSVFVITSESGAQVVKQVNGIPTESDIFIWFAGVTGEPPYPLVPMGCGTPTPLSLERPSADANTKLTVIIRDPFGGEAVLAWRAYVATGCG